MTMAKLTGGILLVAKLDRLSRDMHFLTGLQKQGVQFRIADMPFVDPLTLHILGALAEHEAHMISERTRLALAEIKKRGLIKLGNPQLHLFRCVDTENAREARLEHLNSFDGNLSNMVSLLTAEGFETCAEICRELNRRGILRLSKTPFTPASVWQFMKKIAKKRMDSHRKAS
jgi:DNA invertase Pin-like site-specific DNA recombinase